MGHVKNGDTSLRSRGMKHPSFSNQTVPPRDRGRREDRAPAGTHGPRATKKHAAEPQVQPKSPGLPCAMVLRLIRDLPGETGLCCHRRLAFISQGEAPESGRQDHTLSPSASCCSSDDTTRPSHPAPNVRDDREAPLLWVRDAREDGCDLPDGARGICTTGNLRMAGMRAPLSVAFRRVGKAKRAHHRSADVVKMVGTLRFAHPTQLRLSAHAASVFSTSLIQYDVP
jgi:hypothetical protein